MKTCRKCAQTKPLDDFYRHSQMADGHLNACKACVCARERQYREKNIDRVQAYDRARGQLPHRKEDKAKRAPKYKANGTERARRYRETHPDAYSAHSAVGTALRAGSLKVLPCERCGYAVGVHAHHEDYSKPLDVVWLCKPCHGERHREINEGRRKAKAA